MDIFMKSFSNVINTLDDIYLVLISCQHRICAVNAAYILSHCVSIIAAIVVEDLAWFVNRLLVPLDTDPKGGQLMQYSDWTSMHIGAIDVGNFVVPIWYLFAIGLATVAYYGAFRKHDKGEL
jgi:hypothetical protein